MASGNGAIIVHSHLEKHLAGYHHNQLCSVITSDISGFGRILLGRKSKKFNWKVSSKVYLDLMKY